MATTPRDAAPINNASNTPGADSQATSQPPSPEAGGGSGLEVAGMAPEDRGDTSGPLEDDLEEAFDRTVEAGVQRLGRTWPEMMVTGFFGGTEVAVGVLALIAVYHETGSHLLAGIAFGIGFVVLLLAHSELFTEGFLVPVMTVVAGRASVGQLARLWGVVLVGNLIGGWLIMWLVVLAFPDYHSDIVKSAEHFVAAPFSVETVALGVLAGALITLMTRMQNGTDDIVGKIFAAMAIGFLLAGLQMFHSILDSLLIFGAIHTGDADFGYFDWLSWLAYTLPANVVGGLVLVTLLRLVRSKERIDDERESLGKKTLAAKPGPKG